MSFSRCKQKLDILFVQYNNFFRDCDFFSFLEIYYIEHPLDEFVYFSLNKDSRYKYAEIINKLISDKLISTSTNNFNFKIESHSLAIYLYAKKINDKHGINRIFSSIDDLFSYKEGTLVPLFEISNKHNIKSKVMVQVFKFFEKLKKGEVFFNEEKKIIGFVEFKSQDCST